VLTCFAFSRNRETLWRIFCTPADPRFSSLLQDGDGVRWIFNTRNVYFKCIISTGYTMVAPQGPERLLLNENPINVYLQLTDKSVRQSKSKKRKKDPDHLPSFDHEAAKVAMCEWLNRLRVGLPNCYDHGNKRHLTCTCLCLSPPNTEFLAAKMAQILLQPKGVRETELKGIFTGAKALKLSGRNVAQEGHNTEEFDRPYRIVLLENQGSVALCVHGFRNLFFLRDTTWKRIRDSANSGKPGPIPHKNLGNNYRAIYSKYELAKPRLRIFFQEIGDKHDCSAEARQESRETTPTVIALPY
jgi:hypothetical protein